MTEYSHVGQVLKNQIDIIERNRSAAEEEMFRAEEIMLKNERLIERYDQQIAELHGAIKSLS